MNIFLVLLKKEIKELLTKQLVLTIAATLLVFHVIGKAVGSHNKASAARNTIVLLDLDRTPLSARVAKAVAAAKTSLKPAPETDINAALAAPEHAAENSFMVIPAGLEAEVTAGRPSAIGYYSRFRRQASGLGRPSPPRASGAPPRRPPPRSARPCWSGACRGSAPPSCATRRRRPNSRSSTGTRRRSPCRR